MRPTYVIKAAVVMFIAFMVGGACGALINVIIAAVNGLLGDFGAATIPAGLAHIVMGSTAVGAVIMLHAAKMLECDNWLDLAADNGATIGEYIEEIETLREYKKRVCR